MELTPAQIAILKALADYRFNVSSRNPDASDLADYPEVKALNLNSKAVAAEIASAPSGLFMDKKGIVPAYKGLEIIRSNNWRGEFYAPKPKAAPVAAPAPVAQPAASSSGYQKGDERFLHVVAPSLPAEGSLIMHGGQLVYVSAWGKSFYLSHDRIEEEGLWDYDGKMVCYVYYRPATPAQIAAHEAEETRKAARTPEQHLAEEPVTADELLNAVNSKATRVSRPYPEGEKIASWPGFNGSADITLIRTAEGAAIIEHTPILGMAHDSCRHAPASALPARIQLALAQWEIPIAPATNDDELECL